MYTQKVSLVAVVDDKEYAGEELPFDNISRTAENFAKTAVYKLGLKGEFNHQEYVGVNVYRLEIRSGKLERTFIRKVNVLLPEASPSEDEFNKELEEILVALPQSFRGFVSSEAWDRGHSSGYHEVLSIARDLTRSLCKCVENYKKELKGEK